MQLSNLIPSRFSSALFEAAHEPKKLLLVDGASHNNAMIIGELDYLAGLAQLFGLSAEGPRDVKARSHIAHHPS